MVLADRPLERVLDSSGTDSAQQYLPFGGSSLLITSMAFGPVASAQVIPLSSAGSVPAPCCLLPRAGN